MSIKITARSTDKPHEIAVDLLVVGVWAASSPSKKSSKGALATLDAAMGGALSKVLEREEFAGKAEQQVAVHTAGRIAASKIVVLGLGSKDGSDAAHLRTFAARAGRAANAERATSAVIVLPEGFESKLRPLAEGVELGAYRFTRHFTGDRKPKAELTEVVFASEHKFGADAKKQIEQGQGVGRGVNMARDLSNEPPNVIFPKSIADLATHEGKKHGFKVTVFDDKEIEKRGMLLLHAVGRGSSHGPRLVHMSYVPSGKAKKRLVFVGKGITFDSGGLSIKPAQGMGEMKHDMSGAANMVGLMVAVAAVKPDVEVHAIMACAENMPDGNAYRPGDIWGSLDGKTVEIINTDAEGRLVLADALTYAAGLEPDLLVDNATLTGACVVALGMTWSAFYVTNEDTRAKFASALKESGEQMWHMPLIDEYKDQLKSDCADLKHTGERWGGSITAGLFLREFIGKTKNWVHCDIAGPSAADRPYGWNVKGATGHGVLTFLSLIERSSK
jgi:leucyl aminopeptidase